MSARTVTGTFKRGLIIGEKAVKTFTLREPTAADYFAAEAEADSSKSITYRAALAARQLVSIDDFEGPFSLAMLGKLSGGDLELLLKKRDEVEALGESEPAA